MLALYTYELQHMILFIIRRDRNRINEIYIKKASISCLAHGCCDSYLLTQACSWVCFFLWLLKNGRATSGKRV